MTLNVVFNVVNGENTNEIMSLKAELQKSCGYGGITREEGLLYVRSVRKFTICEVSEEGLLYVRSVRKV